MVPRKIGRIIRESRLYSTRRANIRCDDESMTLIALYLSNLSNGRAVLWCYLIWWASTVVHHFDPSPALWINSLGISALIGVALILSVSSQTSAQRDRWQIFRLFAMPFCVSSFSSLIKGKGFWLVFSPSSSELAMNMALCTLFVFAVLILRKTHRAAGA